MDMIYRDMSLQKIDARLLTRFAGNGADPFCDLATQRLVAILGDPDNMQVHGKDGVGTMTIVTHAPQSTQNLFKLSPKGGGLAPSNWRQEGLSQDWSGRRRSRCQGLACLRATRVLRLFAMR